MEAIVYERFGGPDVLSFTEADRPEPGPGQVRVKVAAAGVNPVDFRIRNGWMRAKFPVTFPMIPGLEVAGVVDALGEGVTAFAVGDEVFGHSDTGAYAEYALATHVVAKPAALAWEQAVALPVAGETSERVLRRLELAAGETLLVHGAAGVVGSVGVQLAVARGATVIGTASLDNHAFVRELGAVPVAYGPGLVERVRALAPQGIDAVYDAAGKDTLPDSVELRGGTASRVVTIAALDAAEHGVEFSGAALADPEPVYEAQARLVAEGRLRIRHAETFPLSEAVKALELSEGGHAKGKLVLIP
ncbi:NADP-dependent oxidoreductase [Streptomyces sp. NBC_00083]|uniref:NADP-dependent oxidoreductase n=1 Tax=Streptomyces sp. NBC_00083 TaxID=2975647 RepID=UPI00225A1AFE|nr:NADP-dependent oxidoreductase [Streptomyces sp. NBC_00083]MCX5381728.1 NADP-dependent oxidoreductase [Streptomyces sp. NBC_00083]